MVQGIGVKRGESTKKVQKNQVKTIEPEINKDIQIDVRFGNSQINTHYKLSKVTSQLKLAKRLQNQTAYESEKAGSTLELDFKHIIG